jgi:16S rRNA (uracil1498-N3)-methyltransferase
VRLRDGRGLLGTGRLTFDGDRARVRVDRVEQAAPPPALRIAVGAGDRDRFGWLVEKATELGVTDLFPLETAHTSGVGSRIRPGQLERLARRALEATKQCGAAWAPAIHPTEPLGRFLARELDGDGWLADPEGDPFPVAASDAISVLVGPEAGFTAAEREAALAAGYRPVRLGEHVLRFETAALAAAVHASLARMARVGGLDG